MRTAQFYLLGIWISLTPALFAGEAWESGEFRWTASGPLQSPARREADPCVSVKDPTVVRHAGEWHLFTTIRSAARTHQIEYSHFPEWKEAERAERHILKIDDGYFCAPQVFFFKPHNKWYLIYQAADKSRPVTLQPAFATTATLGDPYSWTRTQLLYDDHPANIKAWIDFWVICDDTRAFLFFTSNDGKFWRAQTDIAAFPKGWSEPVLALQADLFEASCTYKLQGQERYLTLIEAIGDGRRYFKAYLAKTLDGEWQPLSATLAKPFAAASNVAFSGEKWADSISHGELLRAGNDERLEIDPANLKFLFQGVRDREMAGQPYGKIPWRLGLLELASEQQP